MGATPIASRASQERGSCTIRFYRNAGPSATVAEAGGVYPECNQGVGMTDVPKRSG